MVSYGNIIKKAITYLAVPFARDNVLEIVSNLASNGICNIIDNKHKWKRSSKTRRGLTLLISSEDMKDINYKSTIKFRYIN